MAQKIETFIASLMFFLAIIFLAVVAILIQYLQTDFSIKMLPYFDEMFSFLFLFWLIFVVERLIHLILCPHNGLKILYFSLFILIFPPLRLIIRRCSAPPAICLYSQWYELQPKLLEELETGFIYLTLPISLLMLPFWMIEIFQVDLLYENFFLHHIVNLGNALIWALFLAEFMLEFSVTTKRGEYLIKHWLELFIIILPMLILTRFMRLGYLSALLGFGNLSELQVFRLAKLRQMLSLYRARAVFNRVLRILTLIDLFRRWQQRRDPQKYLAYLQEQLAYHQEQVAELQQKMAETQRLIDEKSKQPPNTAK